MTSDRPTRWYRDADMGTRLHVAIRWATCPFDVVEPLLAREGRIADWGCGHGALSLHLAQRSPGRSVDGFDIDAAKLARARAAAAASPMVDRLSFEEVAHDAVLDSTYDGIVISDVLYLLAPDHQRDVVEAAAAALAPGGAIVIKDMAPTPRWKALASRAQEQVSVRLARITASGSGIHPGPGPQELAGWLTTAGLATEVRRADRGYHSPHVVVVGRRHP
jgi:2-polyprenyl-3-methyl-5-hydroxy-6-metoxy-1,4-benzoquinol methylase